jgi:Uncharacterized protein conserved in bacteria
MGGFAITDEVRVTIAAQACLLLLHRKTDYFPGLLTILVYPLSYMVEAKRQIAEHLWEEGTMNRLGETGRRMGSWFCPGVPSNMVQLIPPMVRTLFFTNLLTSSTSKMTQPTGCRVGDARTAISLDRVMRSEFASLRAADESGVPTLLDTYGATDPAEFFAVSVEAFFEQAACAARHHPKLYAELRTIFSRIRWNFLQRVWRGTAIVILSGAQRSRRIPWRCREVMLAGFLDFRSE